MPRINTDATLIVNFDSGKEGKDFSSLSVIRREGRKYTYLKTFSGKEADDLYAKLTRKHIKKVEKGNKHE